MATTTAGDVPFTALLSNITTNTTAASIHVLERYTQDQLYGLYRPAISLINKYVTPLWYVIGFPANLLAFSVWIQPRMRPSSGCYLAALAMADFIFLILQLIFELQSTWDVRLLKVPVLCEAFPVFFLASQYLSPLLVLGFTVERYISICHPFKREKYCSTSRAVKVIAGLVLCSILLHAVQGYFWIYRSDIDECTVRLEVTEGGPKSIWSIWSWVTELLVFGLVPLAILVLNILVIKETRKLSKTEETVLCLKKGHKSSAATVTLLAVSFFLIFTTLPVTVFYAMYFSFPEGDFYMTDEEIASDPTWQRHFTYYLIRTVIQELGMSHYACNFFIYLLTGKIFRRELKILFFKAFCKSKLDRLRRRDFTTDSTVLRSSVHSPNNKVNGAVAHL